MTNLQKIIEACRKVSPRLTETGINLFDEMDVEVRYHPIQLTDVIMAIQNHEYFFNHAVTLICKRWNANLSTPLSEQSEDTIDFIASLL